MPRKAPDGVGVTEHRITFGTYERQFVKEIKTDIETGAKIAAVSAVAVPVVLGVSVFAGLAGLGYGIYRGLDSFGFGTTNIDPETIGCILRKYARATIPFGLGRLFVDDCDLAKKKRDETPYEGPWTTGDHGGGSVIPRKPEEEDWVPPTGRRQDSPSTSTRGRGL